MTSGINRIAVIDIGTNTVLYLLASDENGLAVLDEGIAPTRLGKGIGEGRQPDTVSIDATIAAVTGFVAAARERNTDKVLIFATEAVRSTVWGGEFARRVEEAIGLRVDVLSAEEEGKLVLLAARRSLALSDSRISAVDVGGGSAQVIYYGPDVKPLVKSYPVGCVTMTERFADGDELNREQLLDYVNRKIKDILPAIGKVVITGGTATTAAAILEGLSEYSSEKLNGKELKLSELRDLSDKIDGLSLVQRKGLVGMPPPRADIFEAGLIVLLAIYERLACDDAILSCQGVRFGAAYRYFEDKEI